MSNANTKRLRHSNSRQKKMYNYERISFLFTIHIQIVSLSLSTFSKTTFFRVRPEIFVQNCPIESYDVRCAAKVPPISSRASKTPNVSKLTNSTKTQSNAMRCVWQARLPPCYDDKSATRWWCWRRKKKDSHHANVSRPLIEASRKCEMKWSPSTTRHHSSQHNIQIMRWKHERKLKERLGQRWPINWPIVNCFRKYYCQWLYPGPVCGKNNNVRMMLDGVRASVVELSKCVWAAFEERWRVLEASKQKPQVYDCP